MISRIGDTFYAFRFLRLLTTPWEKTGAYKRGILDERGNVIRKPSSSEDYAVYNVFHKLVFNIKRLINKIPLGKTTVASYIAALYLIKEKYGVDEKTILDFLGESAAEQLQTLSEDAQTNLLPGEYSLAVDVALPANGELLARRGSVVQISESQSVPVSDIFGIPIWCVSHRKTRADIYVSYTDLKPL